MAFRAGCPACGAEVIFKSGSSIVVVCEFCHSVVARTDRGVEDMGKVADVVESGSPLEVGLRGAVRNVPFTLTGRAQFAHPAGGVWDEWYAAFADGRWGWLAEAQGRFYMTFEMSPRPGASCRPTTSSQLGQTIWIGGQNAASSPRRRRASGGPLGEMPDRLVPNETYLFADLSGPRGEFATLDYGDRSRPPSTSAAR